MSGSPSVSRPSREPGAALSPPRFGARFTLSLQFYRGEPANRGSSNKYIIGSVPPRPYWSFLPCGCLPCGCALLRVRWCLAGALRVRAGGGRRRAAHGGGGGGPGFAYAYPCRGLSSCSAGSSQRGVLFWFQIRVGAWLSQASSSPFSSPCSFVPRRFPSGFDETCKSAAPRPCGCFSCESFKAEVLRILGPCGCFLP